MSLPEYCQQCSWLMDKMGACQPPQASFFFSIVSFLPYILIILFVSITFLTKQQRPFKMAILLLSAYIVGDRIFKNIIRSPRPPEACKKTFGFPSSHMVVMTCYAAGLWERANSSQKIFLIFLVIIQGFARVQLKYHDWSQVIGGIVFAIIYTALFLRAYERISNSQKFISLFQRLGIRRKVANKNE